MSLISMFPSGDESGGVKTEPPENDVNFYDYDGTRLYSYTLAEAQALTELPPLPTQPGLICQEWNWTLDEIKNAGHIIDVGATYITDDGATRIYVELDEYYKSPIIGLGVSGTVTIDWGDGSEPTLLTGTNINTTQYTSKHEYAEAGIYKISLIVNGKMRIYGDSNRTHIIRQGVATNNFNARYISSIKKIELGSNVVLSDWALRGTSCCTTISIPREITTIGTGCFYGFSDIKAFIVPKTITTIGNYFANSAGNIIISIPPSVTKIGTHVIGNSAIRRLVLSNNVTSLGTNLSYNNFELRKIVLSKNITTIGNGDYYNNKSLRHINIPNEISVIGNQAFQGCEALGGIIFNDIQSVGSKAFYDCAIIKYIDFSNCTSIPTLSATDAFANIPATCEIRVPAALYDEWINATNWSTYASQIVAV